MSLDYLKSFLIGGSIIAGSKYISKKTNPAYGSIIAGVPTGIISSFFLSDTQKKPFFEAYSYHSFILTVTINIIYQLIERYNKKGDVIQILGLIIWGVISFIITKYYILKK